MHPPLCACASPPSLPSTLHPPWKKILSQFFALPSLQLDYSGLGVQQVWDCTGVFLTRKALQPYFDAGVPKVVVSAPVKDPEHPVLNIVYGVNHVSYWLSCLDGSVRTASAAAA